MFVLFSSLRIPDPCLFLRRRQWQATPVLLPRKSHRWRSLVGCSPWGREEWDVTEWLHFHFSLSHNGEGNGNPLQCSCLESPRDGTAWWAAVCGVTQSRTRLKRLSSSSSISSSRAPDLFLLLRDPGLLINLPRNWLSQLTEETDKSVVLLNSLVAQTVKCLPVMWGPGFNPWVGKIPWRRKWQPTPVL